MKTVRSFFRFTIVKEILLGYLVMAGLIIAISVFSLVNLEKMNEINESIVRQDVQVIKTAEEMIDNIFEQEQYANRYRIFDSGEMLDLFRAKSMEFEKMVRNMRALAGRYAEQTDRLLSIHKEYGSLILNRPGAVDVKTYGAQVKQKQNELVSLIRGIAAEAESSHHRKLVRIEQIGAKAVRVAGILSVAGIVLSIGASLLITGSISRSVGKLKQATEEISTGKFDYTMNINRKNEFGDLSRSFMEMTQRLKRLEEMYLDASPLTYLPGGLAVEKEIRKRLEEGSRSAFCFADLDNFKAYNDRYGYTKGSEMIKASARLIEEIVKGPENFVGHIGGDDFVFIVATDLYRKTCDKVIARFDEMVRSFYDPDDIARGYITSKTRTGQESRFPVMTISIAVVINRPGRIRDPIQVGEIASELKAYAKSKPRSICVADRRCET
ncbi:MAG: diguanylate cyclase [Nitrospirae bacterium]|nr:diguanylate cyclase [Nitrospirota bacterium]